MEEKKRQGNRKRVSMYRNFYGLYFVFADRVFNKISESKGMSVLNVKRLSVIYYLQKYVIKRNDVVIVELSNLCGQFGYDDINTVVISKIFKHLHNTGDIEKHGNRYRFTRRTSEFMSSFSYWMHFYTSNFHELVEGRKQLLKEQRIASGVHHTNFKGGYVKPKGKRPHKVNRKKAFREGRKKMLEEKRKNT